MCFYYLYVSLPSEFLDLTWLDSSYFIDFLKNRICNTYQLFQLNHRINPLEKAQQPVNAKDIQRLFQKTRWKGANKNFNPRHYCILITKGQKDNLKSSKFLFDCDLS